MSAAPDQRRVTGRFIVLEGGDGAGKSSVLAALAAAMTEQGRAPVVTREPGGTPEGLELRRLLVTQTGTAWDPAAELLLMVASRVQHVRRVILPALAAGLDVLCDRFVGSTLAYQGAGRGIDPALILALHRDMAADLWPEITLMLDLDPAIGLARSRARAGSGQQEDEGRFEALDLAFHERVRAAYRTLAATRAGWHVIDAAQPLAHVIADAIRTVATPACPM